MEKAEQLGQRCKEAMDNLLNTVPADTLERGRTVLEVARLKSAQSSLGLEEEAKEVLPVTQRR